MKLDVNTLCFVAMIGYAAEISVADLKLAHCHPKLLTLLYASGVMTFAALTLLIMTFNGGLSWSAVGQLALLLGMAGCWFGFVAMNRAVKPEGVVWPQGWDWLWVVVMAVVSFIAAWAHFTALNEHSGAVRLSMFYMLLPVATSIPAALAKGEWPKPQLLVAWALACVALYLVSTIHPAVPPGPEQPPQ